MKNISSKKKGSTLIITLLILFLLSSMTLSLGYYSQKNITTTKMHLDQYKSLHIAKSVVQLIIKDMEQDKEEGDFDALQEPWIKNYNGSQRENVMDFTNNQGKVVGSYQATISDECNRLNINLVNTDMMDKLLQYLKIPSSRNAANEIIAYRNNKKEIKRIISLYELLSLKSVTPQLLLGEDTNENGDLDPWEKDGSKSPPYDDQDNELDLGLKDYLTIFSDGKVNINTASQAVLLSLPGMNHDLAKVILRTREKNPFQSLEELKDIPSITETLYQQIKPWTTVQSDLFRVNIHAQSQNDTSFKDILVIIDRSVVPTKIVYWREN